MAVTAADAIGIPVTGIDLLVPDVTGTEYVFIEANERPGLANHEPQPTAQAFVDYLFPGSPGLPQAWTPDEAQPDTPSKATSTRVQSAARSGDAADHLLSQKRADIRRGDG